MSTTTSVPAQDFRAEHTLPDHLNLPPAFDAKRWPILAQHVFGLAPERPALRLVSSQPSTLPDDIVDDPDKTASTQRSQTAVLLAWQRAFLFDQHGEVRP